MEIKHYIVFAISYLLGAIPWALIVSKVSAGIDIREEGTGNVGAMNTYESTGSKLTGFVVLLLDMAKGAGAVLLARYLTGDDFPTASIAGLLAVTGHNFNIFLKFKGGRGLASAAGAVIFINPIILIIWFMLYLAGLNTIMNQVHVGSSIATVLTPFIIYLLPPFVIGWLMMIEGASTQEFLYFSIVLSFLIMLRHIKPLIDLSRKKK